MYVIHFIAKLYCKLQRDVVVFPESLNVETEETLNAERLWVKSLQSVFHDDVSYDQLKNQFGVVLKEEGILHCRGRLQHSKLPYSQKFPALSLSDSYVMELIIQQWHECVFHNKARETLNELRSHYWVPKARQKVRKIIYKCVTCRRFEGQPYVTPVMAPLPEFRLDSEVPAFQTVGLDYCGPVYLKSRSENGVIKAWICLFSCSTSRGIHLELVPFIRALRCFVGRRGIPSLTVSDNAKTYKAAHRFLSWLFKQEEVQVFLNSNKIHSHFILEKAPWNGGFYERMVQNVKRNLHKSLKNSQLNFEELTTVLVEVEAVINSRPLTYMYPDDIEEMLTPAHLILGK